MAPPIILFDYDFSVYGQRTRLVLHAANIPFRRSDQPIVLPRPDLEALGITYRRIPLLAIGKDIYCDTSRIIDAITGAPLNASLPPTSPADKAYEAWGNATFQTLLTLIPHAALTPDFIRDRKSVFSILEREDYRSLRGSGLAALKGRMRQIEEGFLGAGPFVGGERLALADLHVIWPVRWALPLLGEEEKSTFGREVFPKVWRLLDALPKPEVEVLDARRVEELVLRSEYTAAGPEGVAEDDLLGASVGSVVAVESDDATPGAFPQRGTLVGADALEVVIQLENGIRLHFPRIGYFIRAV